MSFACAHRNGTLHTTICQSLLTRERFRSKTRRQSDWLDKRQPSFRLLCSLWRFGIPLQLFLTLLRGFSVSFCPRIETEYRYLRYELYALVAQTPEIYFQQLGCGTKARSESTEAPCAALSITVLPSNLQCLRRLWGLEIWGLGDLSVCGAVSELRTPLLSWAMILSLTATIASSPPVASAHSAGVQPCFSLPSPSLQMVCQPRHSLL
jgi:hypothetical protein